MITSDDGKQGDAGLTSSGDVTVTPRRKLKLWHKILIAAAAVVVGITAIPFYLTSGISGVVEEHISAIRTGKLDNAYGMTAKQFQKITSRDDFTSFVGRHKVLAENKEVSISSRQIKNGIGTIVGTATAKGGTSREVRFRLIKEEGDWKIVSIHVKPDETK
ncbi:MAG: DUF4864 domain-containing protein [Methyloligellaceae bacterium]